MHRRDARHGPRGEDVGASSGSARSIIPVSFDEWLGVFRRTFPGWTALFVHPFSDRRVMAGNGTIGLEILEDLPEVDTVVDPVRGRRAELRDRVGDPGARTRDARCSRPRSRPRRRSPVARGRRTGARSTYTPSFVDGIGAPKVFPEMFELARTLLDGSLVVEPDAAADAVRLLATRAHAWPKVPGPSRSRAATAGLAGPGKVVAIVSGGNIDASKLATILAGGG